MRNPLLLLGAGRRRVPDTPTDRAPLTFDRTDITFDRTDLTFDTPTA